MSIESDDILIQIQRAAAGPLRVRGDAGEVEQPKLTDLISAHKYLSDADVTVGRSPRRGIRYSRIIPPGAV